MRLPRLLTCILMPYPNISRSNFPSKCAATKISGIIRRTVHEVKNNAQHALISVFTARPNIPHPASRNKTVPIAFRILSLISIAFDLSIRWMPLKTDRNIAATLETAHESRTRK